MRELALGARLTLAGGRAGLLRTAVTALGVALGVAVLLVATSIPSVHEGRQSRGAARSDEGVVVQAAAGRERGEVAAGAGATAAAGGDAAPRGAAMLVADADTRFRGRDIRGRLLEPEGAGAPLPPGVSRAPRPGEVVVSPALRRVLATPDGRALLAPRLPGRVAGEIGKTGLLAPSDLAFYAGARDLRDPRRVERFGASGPREPIPPVLTLLIVITLVALLLPVAVLVGAAVRTGGEDRDRRLAALRLVGADQRMARRVAAGEALLSAALGLVLGAVTFLVARGFADGVSLGDTSVYAPDLKPDPLLGLTVLVGVPAAAVFVSLLALRRVVAEPLGVVRRAEATRRRRLWWRLLLPAAGLLALAPAAGVDAERVSELRVGIGVIALLIGVAALLPWLVERVVARLGAGKVAWQLAVRRLQLDPGGPARAVSGITVAVAGAIALQMVFTGVQRDFETETGADLARANLYLTFDTARADTVARDLAAVPGVRSASAVTEYSLRDEMLYVAPCATLRELITVSRCAEGDAFAAGTRPTGRFTRRADVREDPAGSTRTGLFATPSAARRHDLPVPRVTAFARTTGEDAVERVRNAAAALDQQADVQELRRTRTDAQFAQIRRAMLVGASIVIALIGVSLLLTALEQLRERRRVLAVLVAFGTRRSTLSWSVLWQSALPVALGIAIAAATGIALGAVLLRILSTPVTIAWADVAAMAGVGVLVVLVVTAASLPVLWRTMRAEGLRSE